jgi:hypothetical protein
MGPGLELRASRGLPPRGGVMQRNLTALVRDAGSRC